jgi:hypothetical protein
MTSNRTLLALSLGLALAAPLALLARSADVASLPSAPTADQATTSRLVYGLLSDSRYAYRPRALDDAMSKDILKRYLESLDPGKVFLTAQDVASFNRYATTLDDAIKGGQVDPGWAIFAVYRQRVDQRIAHARKLLKGEISISVRTSATNTTARTRRGRPATPSWTRCGRSRSERLAAPEAGRQAARRDPQDPGQALREPALQRQRTEGRGSLPDLHQCLCRRDRPAHRLPDPAQRRKLQPCRSPTRWRASVRCCSSRTT